ncbi:hypothetical protein, partial [Amycolatopsis japonica]
RVGTLAYARDGSVQIKARDNGEGWIRKHPRGKEDEQGTYTLTAPAQAPRLGLTKPIYLGPGNGESSLTAAAPADEASAMPVSPLSLVGWRPAKDETGQPTGPQTLLELLREYPLWRDIEPRLRDPELAKTPSGLLNGETDLVLAGTKLPAELREMILEEAELDLVKSVWQWLDDILNEMDPYGKYVYPYGNYAYSDSQVEAMSGGLTDAWVVEQLRELARADWHGQLIESDVLTLFGGGVFTWMLRGFVDAAVRASTRGGVLPSVQGVLYVEQGDDTSAGKVREFAEQKVTNWLRNYYRSGSEAAQALLTLVDIRAREVPPGDARIGTAWVHVEGQRPPGGFYGWVAHSGVDGPSVEERLRQAGLTREDAVFRQAGEVVSRYNEEPSRYAGEDPRLQELYQARHENAVARVAVVLHRNSHDVDLAERLADELAFRDAPLVGPLRRHGVLGDESKPVSGLGSRLGSVLEPGWFVPVGDGVGVVEVGMVLGDVGSEVGLAGAWLPYEEGVFGVVVTGHRVPAVATVVEGLFRAGWNGSDEVRFFLCFGEGLPKLAGDLANEKGVVVSYPVEQVLFGVAGDFEAGLPAARVGTLAYARDGSPVIKARDNGEGWIRKHPRGKKDEQGTYTLTAPAQAPRLGLTKPIYLGPGNGESSRAAAAPADEASVMPVSSVDLVGWRPGLSGPQTLLELLREYPLWRDIEPRLRDPELAKTPWSRLGGGKTDRILAGTKLPAELREMVLEEAGLDLVNSVWGWLDKILNEMDPNGDYVYSAEAVAKLSGGVVDAWVVEELREVARADWHGLLTDSGRLAPFAGGELVWMLRGFVDAAVGAHVRGGLLPSVQGVLYVEQGDVTSAGAVSSLADRTIETWLSNYPPMSVSVQSLLALMDIRTREVPPGDARIGTAWVHVEGQRRPGGFDDLIAHRDVSDSSVEELLEQAGLTREDAVFRRAREVVNTYNEEPSRFAGEDPRLQQLYQARYEDRVAWVALVLHRDSHDVNEAERLAHEVASSRAVSVGPRRRHGVLGGESMPVSGLAARRESGVELGWVVPAGDGVGVVEAGMVLGDVGSEVGLAGAWLPYEEGVFGVVVTGHRVPAVATVMEALFRAGWNGSDEVRFFLCFGEGLPKLAGDLANEKGVVVSYPVEQVLFGVAGDFEAGLPAARVGTLAYARDGSPVIKARDNGEGWIRKHPRGKKDEQGTYTLTAPAQAPRLGLTKTIHLGPSSIMDRALTGSAEHPVGEVGESARAGAARADVSAPADAMVSAGGAPAVPASLAGAPEDVAGWRPAADGTGPWNLWEFLLLRGIAYWLSDDNMKKTLLSEEAKLILLRETPFGQLPEKVREKIWEHGELDKPQLKEGTRILLEETPLGQLPAELLMAIREQVGLDPVLEDHVKVWFERIKDERRPDGEYSYEDIEVAVMSGGLVDEWVVKLLRGEARADWHGQLIDSGMLTALGKFEVFAMLLGFVDAAMLAPPSAMPSVQGILYVGAGSVDTSFTLLKSLMREMAEYRLGKDLLALVDLEMRVVPPRDPRAGTARFHVEGQRPPGGLYGLEAYDEVGEDWEWYTELQVAREELDEVDRGDVVFTRARELVNRYNEEPWQYTGLDPRLVLLHLARYEAAVEIVAGELVSLSDDPEEAERAADEMAFRLADAVGARRRYGVIGGGPGPLPGGVSGQGTRARPGWLLRVSDSVGILKPGMILGDLDSPAGRAARWLPVERGAFAVAITGRRLPGLATVKKALWDAGWNGTEKIRLFLSASRSLPKYAGSLADALQVEVAYPEGKLVFGAGGGPAARVARIEHTIDGLPRIRPLADGTGWITRKPGGETYPSAYVLTAPVQAPRLGLPQPTVAAPPVERWSSVRRADSVAEAFNLAYQAFTERLIAWRDARPGVVVPTDVAMRLHRDFVSGFRAVYEASDGAGQRDWRSWLTQAAAGLHDTFDQAILASPADTDTGGEVREWPVIPSDPEEARDWVYYDGGLSQGRFGKSPAKDFEPFIPQATKIVSLSHRVPTWTEKPERKDEDAVRLNNEVKYLIAKYLANGWSEQDAQKLSGELAVKLGTARGLRGRPVPVPGGARVDEVPEVVGESSRAGAARGDGPTPVGKVSSKPFRIPPAPAELVEWRPATDENGAPVGPRTLREALSKVMLERGIAHWLSDANRKKNPVSEETRILLEGTRLAERLPLELQLKIRDEVELDPVSVEYARAWAKEWLDRINDETYWFGAGFRDYRYLPRIVAEMSGGLIDAWVVEQSRGRARTDWTMRLDTDDLDIYGELTFYHRVTYTMLEGFVDAAVRAAPGEMPRLLGVRYVAEQTPGKLGSTVKSAALSTLTTAWSALERAFSRDPLLRLIKDELKSRLKEHRERAPRISVTVGDLLAQTDIRTRVVPAGDPRVGLVHLHAEGTRRLLGGWYGLDIYDDGNDPLWGSYVRLQAAHRVMGVAGVVGGRDVDSARSKALEIVNAYNQDPSTLTGQDPLLESLYGKRHAAAVEMVAARLRGFPGHLPEEQERHAGVLARQLADWVGLRRRHGVVGDVSGEGARPGSGWLVPVGARVGVVEAGMVLGDLGSMVGQAARWLRREPGVFGVVVTGHAVPDLETVLKALEDAGWNGKDAVRFFLCYQEGLPKLVKGLANSFRGKVLYPGKQVWFGVAGGPAAGVGRIEYVDGKPQVRLADKGGGWLEEDGSGKPKPGTYVLPASAKAPPRLGLPRPTHLGPATGSPVSGGGGSQVLVPEEAGLAPAAPRLGLTKPINLGPGNGESSLTAAAPADEASAMPVSPLSLAGWRPADDGPGSKNLLEYLREHSLWRDIEPRLRDPELAKTPLGRLLNGETDLVLADTELPPELREMVLEEAELDLVKSVWKWLDDILNEMNPGGVYRYDNAKVAAKSGGLIDEWAVKQLRGPARTDWYGPRLRQRYVLSGMLRGFVDAAVHAVAWREVLPSVRGVLYVAKEDADTSVDELYSIAKQVVRARLAQYPSVSVSVDGLMERVDIRARVLGPDYSRIDTVALHVERQMLPNGWYGPNIYENGGHAGSAWANVLDAARAELADVDDGDEVYAEARALVNKYTLEASEIPEKDPYLQGLYETRYNAAVVIVAGALNRFRSLGEIGKRVADGEASALAGWVGWYRQNGVVGGVPAWGVRSDSGVELGWVVPVGVGVGVVEAGMVLGDVGSEVGLAGAWLPYEEGVFGVVVT